MEHSRIKTKKYVKYLNWVAKHFDLNWWTGNISLEITENITIKNDFQEIEGNRYEAMKQPLLQATMLSTNKVFITLQRGYLLKYRLSGLLIVHRPSHSYSHK